jgi:sugar phosphate permease
METTTENPKIFYGWYLVGVSLISGAFQTGIGIWGVSVFVSPMEDELGWSRTSFMVALSIRTALTGLLSPLVGPWRDTKNGPRALMLTGSTILGISLIALKYVDSLWQFYLFFGVFGSIGALGAGGILTQTILPKWFIRKRGRALGIASMGGGTGPLIFPIAILGLITCLGWRDAWLFLGVVALVLLVPLSFLVKTRPEDMGLLPDGMAEMPPEPGTRTSNIQTSRRSGREVSFSGKQALGTPAFWLIVFAFALGGLGQQGFQSNWIPYLEGEGFSTKTATLAISVYGVCSVSARIIWGTLADQHSIRHLIVIQSLLTATSVLVLIYVVGPYMLFFFVIFFGLTMGGSFILRPLIVANYFGREHIGAITGYMRPFQGLTSAIGPMAVAVAYDAQGSYFLSFVAVMIGYAFTGTVIMLAAPPKVPVESVEEVTESRESTG